MISKKRHDLYRYFISLLFPNVCAGCGETIDYNDDFCPKCKKQLVLYNNSFNIEFVDVFAAYCVYEGIARDAVLSLKDDSCGNAYYAFACGIFEKLRQIGQDSGIDIITCVPMYIDDMDERGYNQAELIAKELQFMLGVPFDELLIKIIKTRNQKTLNGEERRTNVKDVFITADENTSFRGKTILLIDDVCTTGSTISEVAKTLKDAGAEKVIAAVFAKTVRNDKEDEESENNEENEDGEESEEEET